MSRQHDLDKQASLSLKELKYDTAYLNIARTISDLSHDKQTRVGSIIVRGGQILSQGWNGTPAGDPNRTRDLRGNTLPTVIHSEANALMKLAKNGGGSDGATIYCTHSPCMHCSLLILQAGIKRVVYEEVYEPEAITFLKERGIQVESITRSSRLSDGKTKPSRETQYWSGIPEG